MAQICLVTMPYAAIERPSLALGLLKAKLREAGLEAQDVYANLWFAREIGLGAYDTINTSPNHMLVGEWTFSHLLFPELRRGSFDYMRIAARVVASEIRASAYIPGINPLRLLARLREQAALFLDHVAEQILSSRPRIVGCTSTFQQHCASLALLKKIRELAPEVVTVIGGANCEGPMGMGTVRSFPYVDFAVSGEADGLIVDLCRKLLDQGRETPLAELPAGVMSARGAGGSPGGSTRGVITSLDETPIPEYGSYFDTLAEMHLSPYVKPGLVVETSRGCWWGARSHCTFCGLNGTAMAYRSKSPERVCAEFEALSSRHGIGRFEVVDNILDMSYFSKVFPAFSQRDEKFDVFYETKANLRREHMEQMAAAGVRYIQPGIESLHDSILKLVAKGSSAWMNVQLLKWARELDIYVVWIFLVRVPGEQDDWYAEMNRWLPWISHLQPPEATANVQFHRFSPYHMRPADFGLRLAPEKWYSRIYPLERRELDDLAYYFQDETGATEAEGASPPRPELQSLHQWIQEWRRQYWVVSMWAQPPRLDLRDEGEELRIFDSRACAVASEHVLSGRAASIYRLCDSALSPGALHDRLREAGDPLSESELRDILEDLENRRLLLRLGGKLLALAVRDTPALKVPPFPGGHIELEKFVADWQGGKVPGLFSPSYDPRSPSPALDS